MTKKQSDAIALLLKAMQEYFNSEEQNPEIAERTPVHAIPPRMYASMCKNLDIDNETASLLATFAISLVLGMMQEPENVSAIVGGDIIVQPEDLSNLVLSSIRSACGDNGNLIEANVGVVNLETGETVSEKTVLLDVKE